MKKLRSKGKTNQAKKLPSESYKGIQQLIFEDVKNINKLNNLIEEYIMALQANEGKRIKQISDLIFEVYTYFLKENTNLISEDLKSFLHDKLSLLFKIYMELIKDALEVDEEQDTTKTVLEELKKFFRYSNAQDEILKQLVVNVIIKEDLVDSEIIKLISSLLKENNLTILQIIYGNISTNPIKKRETFFNIYNYLIAQGKLSESQEKILFQSIIVLLVNMEDIPSEILTNLLINLNKVVFANLENPLIFSDYLINLYEKVEDCNLKVLALSGLFILITKFKLDYSDYYNMLYKTICLKTSSSVFDCKYRNRLFKILSLSLKSAGVPMVVIYSFIKKLVRECLVASPSNVAIILSMVQNIVKVHPRAITLLLRKKKNKINGSRVSDEKVRQDSQFNWDSVKSANKETEVSDAEDQMQVEEVKFAEEQGTSLPKYEKFDEDGMDAYRTSAESSCLWELYTLKTHFSFKIRQLVNKFESNFLKKEEFDLNSISGLKDEDMLYPIGDKAHFYLGENSPLDKTLNLFK